MKRRFKLDPVTQKNNSIAEKTKLLFLALFAFTLPLAALGQGSTYTGTYIKSTPLKWSGISNQTISGIEISNPSGDCISLTNCSNITIKNCKLTKSLGKGVYLYNCKNVTITNCSMDSVSTGVYAGLGGGIKVMYNDVKNVIGPYPRGQMVQFAQVSGGGNYVNYNVEENIMGQSNPEDAINMYMSSGLPTDPIQIIGNWIRGGGPSQSGAGIQVGDGGGSNILVKDNILVNPGSCGISIATGNNISVKSNKVYAGYFSFNFRGITVRNLYSSTTTCYSDTVMNNDVNYTSGTNSCTYTTSYLNSGACGEVIGWSTNVFNTSLNESILPPVIIGRAALEAGSSIDFSSTDTSTSGSTTTTNTSNSTTTTSSGTTTTTTTKPGSKKKRTVIGESVATENNDPTLVDSENAISVSYISGRAVVVKTDKPENVSIVIYNLNGQKVIEKILSETTTEISTRNLKDGVYVVKISDMGKIIETKKMIVS